MALTRRQFLSLTGGAGALMATGAWAGLLGEQVADGSGSATTTPPPRPPRTLVVVQLGGGNDGLNTVVPEDGRYRDARPSLGIPEAELLRPAGLTGASLHPALAPLVAPWTAGSLAIVQSLGYAHAGRSHFECSQHWWDGAHPGQPTTTGWIGRWLDSTAPAEGSHPLRAVALGAGSPALRAERTVATVVLDPRAFAIRAPRGVDAKALADAFVATAAPLSPDALLAASQRSVASAMAAVDTLKTPLAEVGAGDGKLTGLLGLAADLVTRRLGIDVITLGASGFDTHSAQADEHAELLADLAGGLARFSEKVAAAGMADQTLVMTTSEFGRRVAQNGSLGTDHGLGGCQLLLGPAVRGGLVGTLDLSRLHDGDLAATIDPRSLFAAGLDWLGGPTTDVLHDHEDLGLLR